MIDTNKSDSIVQFYLDHPETELQAFDIAEQFDYLPHLPRAKRSEAVRDLKKKARRSNPENLVLKSKWQQQKKGGEVIELRSWRTKESDFLEKLSNIKDDIFKMLEQNAPHRLNEISYEKGEYLAEINVPDFHFGKADGRTIDEQCNDYLQAIHNLVSKIRGYQIEKFLLVIGNDMFQVDNANHSTTKGTIVDRNCDWDEMYSKGLIATMGAINFLAGIAPVDVICVPGNHDKVLSFTAGEALKHYYSGVRHINVVNVYGTNRKYYSYGKNLLMYTHGDKEKLNDLPLIMAVEEPIAFSKSDYRYVKIGHLHHSILRDIQGVEIETIAALCKSDRWHREHGYLSRPKAQVSVYNKALGKEGVFIVNG